MPCVHCLQRIRPPAMAIRSPDQTGLVRDNVMAVFDHVLEIDLAAAERRLDEGRAGELPAGMTLQCKSTSPASSTASAFTPESR